ncbi:MAG TPA: hypothetical protein DEO70_05840 [Bacteroidales bacterium]|nr:hypothetical protein [Bacteroidales bacterium]
MKIQKIIIGALILVVIILLVILKNKEMNIKKMESRLSEYDKNFCFTGLSASVIHNRCNPDFNDTLLVQASLSAIFSNVTTNINEVPIIRLYHVDNEGHFRLVKSILGYHDNYFRLTGKLTHENLYGYIRLPHFDTALNFGFFIPSENNDSDTSHILPEDRYDEFIKFIETKYHKIK